MRRLFQAYSETRQSTFDELSASPAVPVSRQSAIDESLRATAGILERLANRFPLARARYTCLLRVRDLLPRQIYEAEALRGGRSVRQSERQMDTQFCESTAFSCNSRTTFGVPFFNPTSSNLGHLPWPPALKPHLFWTDRNFTCSSTAIRARACSSRF